MALDPNNPEENTSTSSDDFVDLDVTTGTSGKKTEASQIEIHPFNEKRWREKTRTFLAYALLANIILTQLSVFVYLFSPTLITLVGKSNDSKKYENADKDKDLNKNLIKLNDSAFVYVVSNEKKEEGKNSSADSRELITLVWTSQVTLLGGALGFYFAAGQNENL